MNACRCGCPWCECPLVPATPCHSVRSEARDQAAASRIRRRSTKRGGTQKVLRPTKGTGSLLPGSRQAIPAIQKTCHPERSKGSASCFPQQIPRCARDDNSVTSLAASCPSPGSRGRKKSQERPRRQGGPAGLGGTGAGEWSSFPGITPGEGEIGDGRCIRHGLYDHPAHG